MIQYKCHIKILNWLYLKSWPKKTTPVSPNFLSSSANGLKNVLKTCLFLSNQRLGDNLYFWWYLKNMSCTNDPLIPCIMLLLCSVRFRAESLAGFKAQFSMVGNWKSCAVKIKQWKMKNNRNKVHIMGPHLWACITFGPKMDNLPRTSF